MRKPSGRYALAEFYLRSGQEYARWSEYIEATKIAPDVQTLFMGAGEFLCSS